MSDKNWEDLKMYKNNTTTTLSKIDSVLEYIQTSSSDLTLPAGTNPRQTAGCLLIDVEKEVRKLLRIAEETTMEIGHYGFASKNTLNKLEDAIRTIQGGQQ